MFDPGSTSAAPQQTELREHIASGRTQPAPDLLPVEIREFVSFRCGSRGVSTGTATFPPAAILPYHFHTFSEAVTVLEGEAEISVEGRKYSLRRLDCIHLPAGIAHRVANRTDHRMVAHWAFASATPSRQLVEVHFPDEDCSDEDQPSGHPESIRRFVAAEHYPLAEGTRFYDLFAGRFGSVGICGGYGEFEPGASLPCHVHQYDESITIVQANAVCQVAGKVYNLSGYDTAFVPEGRPHRFLNGSPSVMAMIWVYAGSEPERKLVPVEWCTGAGQWPVAVIKPDPEVM